ncbi:MAG: SDR family NAD(P)-dependent oxidoreductase [Desulfobacterales bacterium]|nr:SDR family NAD(P)-dependent oxidoreductase [Desulfobacterales bacterium]
MIGITSYGAYIPRLRLDRMAIFQAMGWFAPAIIAVAQGERSMCNWDEDSITMAVSASKDCIIGKNKNELDAILFSSTTFPFADRQNAGIVATALNMRDDIIASDFASSQKAGSTALITALDMVLAGERKNILVTAADKRETKAAYFYEMWFGDGAASVMVGDKDVIAEYKGSYSVSYDFVDHFRGSLNKYDYVWEERWARDEGFTKIIPEAVYGLLKKLKLTIADVDKLVFPCIFKAEQKNIAKKLGLSSEKVIDNLHEVCGEIGTAHGMLMLVKALEESKPGDRILMVTFGQGANALYFQVTENIKKLTPRNGFKGTIKNKEIVDNYPKWLRFRELLQTESGIRAEAPTQTAMTTLWRKRKMILGLVGGRCRKCGTAQFPKMDICVNPNCGAIRTQDDYEFSDIPAKIKTFTSDLLAVSIDPPHQYGMIQFEGGGRFMADFTDCRQDDLKVGLPVKLAFRKRFEDKQRGFTGYFWKAAPVPGAAEEMAKKEKEEQDRISFDGKIAIITGAGGGLGRIYALELAKRGAKIVVNDFGGSRDGSGQGAAGPADKVVEEIKALGGEAVPNYDNVATIEGGKNIVKTALDNFGKVDILINNAGILRDKSFLKMDEENWKSVLSVHLNGAYFVTQPAFEAMKKNGYGRIIMTSSAAGLYGNFGQTNYSAAKMALVGLMNTLKIEGASSNIKVNTVAPLAASRLTEDVMPPEIFEKMKPEFVAPMVLYLCSDQCKETGAIFNAGMGYFNRCAVLNAPPVKLGDMKQIPTVEEIHENFSKINSLSGATEVTDATLALIALAPTQHPAPYEVTPKQEGEKEITPKTLFEKIPDTFKPESAKGIDVTFQFNVSGSNGGDWLITIKNQTCKVEQKAGEKATCILKISDTDFVELFTGKSSPMKAYTSGKLKIEGDIMKSQLIEKLFTIKK